MRRNLARFAVGAGCGSMTAVRRGFLHVGAWALATAAAVTLSWFGVRSVLRGTAYDPPLTLPVTGVATSSPPVASSTHRPKPTTPPAPHTAPPTRTVTPAAPPSATATVRVTVPPPKKPAGAPRPTATASDATGNVRSYSVAGGRVVLDLGPSSASLVSATPDSGWQMQIWANQPGWLRVTFTSASGDRSSSVFCTWNGTPPMVQTYGN